MARGLLALDSEQPIVNLEDHVVTAAFAHRAIHIDSEFDSRDDDRSLCDVAFLIC